MVIVRLRVTASRHRRPIAIQATWFAGAVESIKSTTLDRLLGAAHNALAAQTKNHSLRHNSDGLFVSIAHRLCLLDTLVIFVHSDNTIPS